MRSCSAKKCVCSLNSENCLHRTLQSLWKNMSNYFLISFKQKSKKCQTRNLLNFRKKLYSSCNFKKQYFVYKEKIFCSFIIVISYSDTHLTLSAMDELIHNTNGLKMGCERSRFCNFWNGGRSMEMVMAAIILDVSRISLFYSLTIVIQRYRLDSVSNRRAQSARLWLENGLREVKILL